MKSIATCALIPATVFVLCGCDAGELTVGAKPVIVNRSSSALSTGLLQWANGTYSSNCTTHSGASWSLQIAGGSPSMDNPALSVVKNNTTCVLTLTSLVTNENTKTTYAASPAIAVGASYAGTASSFASGASTAFYGNAAISPADFSSNFTMTILYSDDPRLATGALTGVYATVTASSSTQNIAAPNYTLDLDTGALTASVDNAFIVQSVSGTAILDAGSVTLLVQICLQEPGDKPGWGQGGPRTGPECTAVLEDRKRRTDAAPDPDRRPSVHRRIEAVVVTGNGYYVDQGTLSASPTFAQLDTAYQGASTTAISGGGNVTIAASAFGLSSVDLSSTVYRTVVIQRVVSGVASYQTFRIGFSHP